MPEPKINQQRANTVNPKYLQTNLGRGSINTVNPKSLQTNFGRGSETLYVPT
jgi:hypothetical protein